MGSTLILWLFVVDNEQYQGSLGDVFAQVCSKYGMGPVYKEALDSLVTQPSDVKLRDKNLFLYLQPTPSKKILPFITLHSCCDWLHFRVYTLLATLDDTLDFKTIAIRFETDEGSPASGGEGGSHDYCHV